MLCTSLLAAHRFVCDGVDGPCVRKFNQVLCSMVCCRPGLKVLTPYSSEDARGLLKAAIMDPDRVDFLENELLYGESFPVSAEVFDSSFCLPIGKAKVINLRSIRPLDRATINTSVRKSNKLVTVEEGFPHHGVGAEIWSVPLHFL